MKSHMEYEKVLHKSGKQNVVYNKKKNYEASTKTWLFCL